MAEGDEFAAVDPILLPWARRHGFRVDTKYKDYAVRSISLRDIPNARGLGQSAQLWVETTTHDPANPVAVCVAIGRWSSRERVTLQELEHSLENQLSALKAKADLEINVASRAN